MSVIWDMNDLKTKVKHLFIAIARKWLHPKLIPIHRHLRIAQMTTLFYVEKVYYILGDAKCYW